MKLKLRDNYHQEFLTTQTGHMFYRKHNQFEKEANVVDVNFENDVETMVLFKQGVLVPVEEEPSTSEDTSPQQSINISQNDIDKPDVKEEEPKESEGTNMESIQTSSELNNTVSEKATKNQQKENKESLENVNNNGETKESSEETQRTNFSE